jgi:hypothetical protein
MMCRWVYPVENAMKKDKMAHFGQFLLFSGA